MTTYFFVGYGTREGRVYNLDANGIPLPTSTTAYTGTKIKGLSGFTSTQTNVRRIQHYDGDRISLTQIFPSLDVPAGTITIDGADLDMLAALSNVINTTVSGMNLMPFMTDQQGSEPSVGLIITQAAKTDEGADGYHMQFLNSSQAVPQPGSFGNNNYETTLALAPSATTHHLWGVDYATNTDGTESAAGDEAFASNKMIVTAWLADGVEDQFDFDANLVPSVNTYKVYINNAGTVTEATVGVTKTTAHVAFGTGNVPTSGKVILAIHDVA